MNKLKKLKKIRLHREGTHNLIISCLLLIAVNVAAYYAEPLTDETSVQEWNNLPRDTWKVVSKSPFVIGLGKKVSISAFTYAPANSEAKPDMAFKYSFAVSTDGKNWKTLKKDCEFSNIMNNPIPQTVSLEGADGIEFIRLDAVSVNGTPAVVDINEIGINAKN